MTTINKILLITFLLASFMFARTSEKYATPASFMHTKISGSTNKIFSPDKVKDEGSDNSIKWKRRHKRRKKDTKRKPSRGR